MGVIYLIFNLINLTAIAFNLSGAFRDSDFNVYEHETTRIINYKGRSDGVICVVYNIYKREGLFYSNV